jgi:hypothetical protein
MEMGDDGRDVEHMGKEEDRIIISSRSSSGGLTLREPLLVKNNNRLNTTSQVAIVGANVCPIESLDYEYVLIMTYDHRFCFNFSFIN